MSNYFCVNKSGKAVTVYASSDETSKKIGKINNREAFGYNRDMGGDDVFCNIVFRNSSGNLEYGYIISPPEGCLTFCTAYPSGTEKIGGTKYYTFKFRKSAKVYTAAGKSWGGVAEDCRVACLTAMSGSSHPEWKGINYVESSNGKWVKVTGDGYEYGFVDTGLSKGSSYSAIPMYGSW